MDRILIADAGEVIVGRGLPDGVLADRPDREQAVIVHQSPARPVAHRVRESIREAQATLVEVPDREEAKTLEVVGRLYTRLAELNVGRHDTILGVGGGAVTDLAGFVAATWLRGIESVMVPTTLLGAVDASIGGKTGINHAGKNLVGAFWHPSRVIVDLDVLEALPEPLLIEGTAEIVKAGFIADPRILESYRLHGLDAPIDVVATRAIRVKADVVGRDFRESGVRAVLNFGHTLGHGIETVAGLSHGHAVAVGMVAAAAVSAHRHGFDADDLTELVSSLGLPVTAPGPDREAVLELVLRDKKRTSEGVRMVLLRAVADPVVETVSMEDLAVGLAAVGIGGKRSRPGWVS